jgi:hypothetical protein
VWLGGGGRTRAWLADNRLRLLLGLLGQKHGLDVGQDSSLGDGHSAEQLVEFLVVTDGQLEVTGDDPGLLVVTGSVAGQLEDFGGEVLHDGGQVDGSSGTDSLGVVALAQQTVDTADRELQTGSRRPRLCLPLHLATLTASGHVADRMRAESR